MPADASKPRDEAEIRREIEWLHSKAEYHRRWAHDARDVGRGLDAADHDLFAARAFSEALRLEASLKDPQP